jgi:hypothetical protein
MTKKKAKADIAPVQPVENTETKKAETVTSPEEIVTESTKIEQTIENKPERPRLTVVIPYLKSAAQGDELRYAVRSIAKNFREDFNLVIVGDREDWFSDEITHLEHAAVSENPQVDVIDKLRIISGDESVSEGFIWTYDDIYFVSPVMLADIQVLKTEGKLKAGEGNSVYARNRNETIRVLQEKNLPLGNFATHTPYFFEKEKISELFEAVPELENEGLLIAPLYFNSFFNRHSTVELDHKTDCWKLRIISKNPDPALFNKYIAGKKWLNNAESGWGKLLQEYLNRKFGSPCRFETDEIKKNGE